VEVEVACDACGKTDSGTTKNQMKEWKRLYYIRKKDEIKESNRLYYLNNKTNVQELNRQYHIRNRDKINASKRRSLLKNTGRDDGIDAMLEKRRLAMELKKKEYNRRYYQENKLRRSEYAKQYYLRNKYAMNESNRMYKSLNKPLISESNRKYYKRKLEYPESYLPRYSVKSWRTPALVRGYFESITKQLLISHPTDWYRISRFQIRQFGGMVSFFLLFVLSFFPFLMILSSCIFYLLF
jgi:hypothetical protein